MNYLEWLTTAAGQLLESQSPKRDAEILLGHITGKSRTFIMAFGETMLTAQQITQLEQLLARRLNGEPVAYITETREFWSLPLKVSTATLIPRPDTERLVELALEYLPATPCEVLDLGAGSGAITLALASERPDCLFTGIDNQVDAVRLARSNADNLSINNVFFLQGDWFNPVKKRKFAMIVSNPPYIDANDVHLEQGDLRFEPKSALVAKNEGLADIQTIIKNAQQHLTKYGWLIIEHGWKQGNAVRSLFKQYNFELVDTFTDYGGNERVTLGRWVKV